MHLAILLLAASAALPTTPRGTWADDGYLQFKWGMGPGDVQEALREPGSPLTTNADLSLLEDTTYTIRPTGFQLAGENILVVMFEFVDGQLFSILLRCEPTGVKGIEWAGRVGHLLTTKYGHAQIGDDRTKLQMAWDSTANHISVTATSNYAWATYVSKSLFRVVTEKRHKQARVEQQKDLEKL